MWQKSEEPEQSRIILQSGAAGATRIEHDASLGRSRESISQ